MKGVMQREWYNYLCHKVNTTGYKILIEELYSQEFLYTLEMDKNRIENVITKEEDFFDEMGYKVDELSDTHFVSVFEVLAVMAIDAEDEIMTNPDYGDRTSEWFWGMMNNLELDAYSDKVFAKYSRTRITRDIDEILTKFMNREYDYDGRNGGAFILEHPRDDLRDVDLWYQLMWWLVEQHPEEM